MKENSVSDYLIAFLLSSRSTRIYRRILWERLRRKNKNVKSSSFSQNIYRLHHKGVIHSKGKMISFSRKKLLHYVNNSTAVIKNIFPKKSEKILISFDIPESKKKTRDWLRNQIKYWDFDMIHKSLWLGHGPLPKEFKDRLKFLSIDKCIRVFKVRK